MGRTVGAGAVCARPLFLCSNGRTIDTTSFPSFPGCRAWESPSASDVGPVAFRTQGRGDEDDDQPTADYWNSNAGIATGSSASSDYARPDERSAIRNVDQPGEPGNS